MYAWRGNANSLVVKLNSACVLPLQAIDSKPLSAFKDYTAAKIAIFAGTTLSLKVERL